LWNERVRRGIAPALPWLVGMWLLGVVVLSLRLLVGWRVVQRLKRFAVVPAAEAWQLRSKDLATRLGISRTVKLVESALIEVPTVIGWLRPMILLPVSVLTNLTPQQLEAVLAHELAHIRRHDYLVNLLQTAIETLLFYHPAVWWLSRLIRSEREHCCDDLALSLCDSPVTYVSALAVMEELRASPALTMAASGGSLLNRIRRIALGPVSDSRRSIWWGASLIALTALVVLGLTTYITSHASDDSPPKAEQNTTISPTEPPAASKADDENAPLLKNAALLPNGVKKPQLEFRIAANLPEDGWEPVLPKDWEQRTYRDGRRSAGKDHEAGFVWYPLSQPWRSDAAFVVSRSTPETAQGNELLYLLSDQPEHGMLMDGSWSVLEAKVVRGKRNPAPGEDLGYAINVRLDDAGQKRFAELVSSYRDMSLAVVMNGEIVGKLLLKEPSARLAFGGHFTKEWAEELVNQLNGLPPDPLATQFRFYANSVTLQEVFEKILPEIAQRAGRKLSVDFDALKAAGVPLSKIVTIPVRDESLRQALERVLKESEVKLDYRLSDDGEDLVVFAPPSQIPASASAPPKGLEFLTPYPKLHGLSLDMTEPQFLEIVKQQELKTRKTVEGEKVTHHIALGDDHTLIVMFDKDAKCSGIQRVRGEDNSGGPSELRTLRELSFRLPGHSNIAGVMFDNNNTELVAVETYHFARIRRWDLVGMKLKSDIMLSSDRHLRPFREGSFKLSGDGRRVIAATDDFVGIWNTSTGELLKKLPFPTREGIYECWIDKLDCTPDLSVIAGNWAMPGRL
ncbi:MAG: M48 family metalloprotease, partial [Planctomycetaceae bacterium]|nr:M48 family metalloprotease [Planctomycetaceae bacterium]